MDYVEYRIVRKDGTVRWVDDYGHYTETDAYGGIFYVFISDITDKRKLREELARREELEQRLALQQQLLEQQHLGDQQSQMITAMASDYRCVYYVTLDTDEGICYRTDHIFPNAVAVGEHFSFRGVFTAYAENYVADSYRPGFLQFIDPENIRSRLAGELMISYRYLVIRDGKESYEMLRMAGVRRPEDRGDNTVHAIGVGFSDIDQEMRETLSRNQALSDALAAAEAANKAKTAFLSNMSHEIRTPMNAIIGLNNIAMNDPELPERTREYLVKMADSANHLLSIINDILDMSRIESGHMVLKHEEFSFSRLLQQVNTIISDQCRDKGLHYDCRTLGLVSDYYVGDDIKLRQVMINILGNAVKFTPQGGSVTFTVEEVARYDGKATLRFVMRDTGIGMSKEFLPKLFDTFSQENASATSRYGSTGLGMPITKSIVELMNGTIAVESEKGAGSTFTVTVTLTESDRRAGSEDAEDNTPIILTSYNRDEIADEARDAGVDSFVPKPLFAGTVMDEFREAFRQRGPSRPRRTVDLKGRRILLAEDMPVNAEILIMLLGMRDMEADHAENGKAALELFASRPAGYYDAILMDMRMPVMDGLEATRAIRALDRPDAASIPIIALTANAFDEDVQRSMQAGLNAHLSKPVDPDTLFATLEELICN